MDISQIDKNFQNEYSYEGMVTYNINDAPFKIYGACRADGETDFKRLPLSVADSLKGNLNVQMLYNHTSGVRVRFRTDSQRITLGCVLPEICSSAVMPQTSQNCFDLYADYEYVNSLHPGRSVTGDYTSAKMGEHGYHSGYTFREKKMREILIHFPLYNPVSEVYVALEDGAVLLPTVGYRDLPPVVYYGSSITQGGCCSHPGNTFAAMISRELNMDFINLGFSGGCLAEPEMSDYIATLPMSAFVFDYDHNAPTLEHLEKTHEPFYQKVRRANPDIPIVFASMADSCLGEEVRKARRGIIKRTYNNAIAAGDKNVFFVDGGEIYKDVGLGLCTVDDTHPNDLGFWCMAKAYGKVLKERFL